MKSFFLEIIYNSLHVYTSLYAYVPVLWSLSMRGHTTKLMLCAPYESAGDENVTLAFYLCNRYHRLSLCAVWIQNNKLHSYKILWTKNDNIVLYFIGPYLLDRGSIGPLFFSEDAAL